MKKVAVILSLAICACAHAADSSNPYKPTVAMTNPETGEGYLSDMPREIQLHILTIAAQARSLTGAAAALYKYAQVNTQFNTIINDAKNIKQLIGMLADKFIVTREQVAETLRLPAAKKYITANQSFLEKYSSSTLSVEQIKTSLPTIDVNYVTTFGNSVLYYAVLYNQVEVVTLLLDNHLNQATINTKLVAGRFPTVLAMALQLKKYAVAQLLIANGAEIFDRMMPVDQVQQYLMSTYGPDILTQVPNLLGAAKQELAPKKQ